MYQINNDLPEGQVLLCGPAVLCAVLGVPATEANRLIEQHWRRNGYHGSHPSHGTQWETLRDIMWEKHKVVLLDHQYRGPVQCIPDYVDQFSFHCLEGGPGHYIVTNAGYLADTFHTIPTPFSRVTKYRSTFVRYGFRITFDAEGWECLR